EGVCCLRIGAVCRDEQFLGIDARRVVMTHAEAANILAKNGYASPSSNNDTSLYGETKKVATSAVASSKLQFVLGDLLPGDLVDEYRVQ
ncbi:hypothetical protein AB9F38_34255, partial [Rhizobium leguminosarum]